VLLYWQPFEMQSYTKNPSGWLAEMLQREEEMRKCKLHLLPILLATGVHQPTRLKLYGRYFLLGETTKETEKICYQYETGADIQFLLTEYPTIKDVEIRSMN